MKINPYFEIALTTRVVDTETYLQLVFLHAVVIVCYCTSLIFIN